VPAAAHPRDEDITLDVLVEAIAAHFGSARPSLVDIGCGAAGLHRRLGAVVADLAGTEASAEAMAGAGQDNPEADYRLHHGGRLPFAGNAFDMSLACGRLARVAPPLRATFLAEMRRVTRPGGLVAVVEDNPLHPQSWAGFGFRLGGRTALGLMREVGLAHARLRHFLIVPGSATPRPVLDGALAALPFGARYLAVGIA
jgi:SAM-dependent methyltransferase